jgi:hypothetical protein
MSGTLRDTINGSARDIGINQQNEVLTGENMTITLEALTQFVDYCSNNTLLVYKRTEYVFPLSGAKSYTLGVGGDWNIPRPMKIDALYTRLNPGSPQQLDIAIQPLTFAQYATISVKNTPSQFPFAYYDDNNYPLRTITMFPIPSGPASVVLWLREPLINLQMNTIVGLVEPFQPGSGYPDGFYLNQKLGGGSGTGALADITVIEGAVANVILKNGGIGYAVNDVLYISPIQVGNNIITSVSITSPGSGYTDGTYTMVPLVSATGIGATGNFTVSGGSVTVFTIDNPGNGFTAGNTLTIVGSPFGAGTGFLGDILTVSSGISGSGFAIQVGFVSSNLDDPINYPPGYDMFFRKSLALYLAPEFGKKVRDDLVAQAGEAKLSLERLNRIPMYMVGDGGLTRKGRNRNWNYITGNFVPWQFGN